MAETSRNPDIVSQVGGALLSIMAYIAFYVPIKRYVPGDEPVKLQVGILGLLLLGTAFSLLFIIDIRSQPE